MNTGGIQFKKFKQDFHYKNTNVKLNMNKLPQPISQVHKKTKEQYSLISPQKIPTSFRQLSGSREKNKIFSGKKIALENKLNNMRSNQKCAGFDLTNEDMKVKNTDFGAAKKSDGLFTKLFTTRSPREINKNLGFDDNNKSSSNGNLDNFGISFSAFKGVNLGQNENHSNLLLQKTAITDQQKQKGLKFKAFPHRRGSQKTNPSNQSILLLNQGPLIQQKGRSHSKSQKSINSIQKQKSPLKTTPTPLIINKVQKTSIFDNQIANQQGLGFSRQQSQEVIRSRQGSIAFDMSPTIC